MKRLFQAAPLLLLVVSGCKEIIEPGPTDLVLVSVDTLRADRLGLYGYERQTSPFLDRVAERGLVFAEALAPTPWTLPSHAAMLTGRHPWDLGIRGVGSALPADAPMLAESLRRVGYRTAAFVDSSPDGFLGAERGFSRGFEVYEHCDGREQGSPWRFDVGATVDRALEWWAATEGPRFLFLHTKSAHALPAGGPYADERFLPYSQPAPFAGHFSSASRSGFAWRLGADRGQLFLWEVNRNLTTKAGGTGLAVPAEARRYLSALYDDGVRWVDAELGRLYETIETGGERPRVWVFTSDHGEAFGEHELFLHQDLQRSTLRVPLVVSGHGIVPGRVDEPIEMFRLADFLRSIGEGGASAGQWVAAASARELFAYYELPQRFDYRAFSLRRGRWKLIVDNFGGQQRRRLYDLAVSEDSPVDDPERSDELEQALRRRLRAETLPGVEIRVSVSDDPLRALGYVD